MPPCGCCPAGTSGTANRSRPRPRPSVVARSRILWLLSFVFSLCLLSSCVNGSGIGKRPLSPEAAGRDGCDTFPHSPRRDTHSRSAPQQTVALHRRESRFTFHACKAPGAGHPGGNRFEGFQRWDALCCHGGLNCGLERPNILL